VDQSSLLIWDTGFLVGARGGMGERRNGEGGGKEVELNALGRHSFLSLLPAFLSYASSLYTSGMRR